MFRVDVRLTLGKAVATCKPPPLASPDGLTREECKCEMNLAEHLSALRALKF
jgi:hypothetical protein